MKSFSVVVILLISTVHQVQSIKNKSINAQQRLMKSLQKNIDWNNQTNIAQMDNESDKLVMYVINVLMDILMKEMTLLQNLEILLASSEHKLLEEVLKDFYTSVRLFVAAETWALQNLNTALDHVFTTSGVYFFDYLIMTHKWTYKQSQSLLNCSEEMQTDINTLLSHYLEYSILNVQNCLENVFHEVVDILTSLTFLGMSFQYSPDNNWATIILCINFPSNMVEKIMGCKEEIRRAIIELRSGTDEFEKIATKLERMSDDIKTIQYCFGLASKVFEVESEHIEEQIFDLNEEMCFKQQDTKDTIDTTTKDTTTKDTTIKGTITKDTTTKDTKSKDTAKTESTPTIVPTTTDITSAKFPPDTTVPEAAPTEPTESLDEPSVTASTEIASFETESTTIEDTTTESVEMASTTIASTSEEYQE